MKQPIKMTPGDDLHLTMLMALYSLNLVTGQDRRHLLGYGRAAFEVGKASQCLLQIQEPASNHSEIPSSSEMSNNCAAAVAVPDEREAFEAFARKYGTWEIKRDDVPHLGIFSYTDVVLVVAWHVWQARAALAATPEADAQRAAVLSALYAHKMVVHCDEDGDPAPLIGFLSLDDVRPGVARDEIEALASSIAGAMAVPAAPAPAGTGGWKIHAENMERDRNYWRDRAQTMHEHQKGECWYWQGDGNDNPESMVNSLPVVIRADALRELLATGGQAQAVDIAELVTGMSVSVDVSTGDDDAGNRYFGTVTVAQEDPHDKHGLTLLVQDAKPNFTPQAQADARDAIRELIAKHSEELEHNAYAYFELAYTRRTGWMAWITDKPLNGGPVINPDRTVLCKGQGDTPEEACSAAIAAAKVSGGTPAHYLVDEHYPSEASERADQAAQGGEE